MLLSRPAALSKKPNYYQILHLHPDAPAPMVRAAYRTIMQKLKAHPDLGGDATNAALINEAYEVLSNADKRKRYDAEQLRAQASEQARQQEPRSSQTKASRQTGSRPPHTGKQSSVRAAKNPFVYQTHGQANLKACLFCDSLVPLSDDETLCCHMCSSPIHIFGANEIDTSHQSNRRAIERLPRSGPVSYCKKSDFDRLQSHNDFIKRRAGAGYFGHAIDLSLTGMRMQGMERLQLEDTLRIENHALIAVASIVNATQLDDSHEYAYGLQFLALSPKQLQGSFVSTAI